MVFFSTTVALVPSTWSVLLDEWCSPLLIVTGWLYKLCYVPIPCCRMQGRFCTVLSYGDYAVAATFLQKKITTSIWPCEAIVCNAMVFKESHTIESSRITSIRTFQTSIYRNKHSKNLSKRKRKTLMLEKS